MSLFVFFISLPIFAQHVSGNHVPIIRSWRLRDVIASCWYVPWLREGCRDRLARSASMDALRANRSPIRPTPLTWHQAISISFLTSRGISRGLISPQMMKWSKLWRRESNKELMNSSLTACVNLFYVGKNVLNDKATMSKISMSICS